MPTTRTGGCADSSDCTLLIHALKGKHCERGSLSAAGEAGTGSPTLEVADCT